ncbi:ABC transporter permease [Gracilimonas sp. Q87]|uniref:ABC transporter permease n=1 Tax=Gracilimonas sp. Q87 TaxID=3384766 RepID=UPI00398452F5
MLKYILKLGWKNVWRNPTRSGVVIITVLLGTWAGIFAAGFFNGMLDDYLNGQINLTVGHVQIMYPEFEDLYNPDYSIPNADDIVKSLKANSLVKEVSAKSVTTGLAQSARNSFGITIWGMDIENDTSISLQSIKGYLDEGNLPDPQGRNQILIGDDLSERLGLELRSRMVLSFQDVNGDITAGAFRVSGIFDSFDSRFDENYVVVNKADLNELLGDENLTHNIRIDTHELVMADAFARELQQEYPELDVKSWRQIAPDLRYVYDMQDLSLYMVMIIIIIGLIFSIINTMLMAVMERTRELGMLRAIGMNKSRTFSMVMLETIFLTMVGSPAGLLLGWLTITYFGVNGIDLSAFSKGLEGWGFTTMIYPSLGLKYYLNIVLLVAIAALISALYPAWRALKLRPVEAIRKFN